MLDIKSIIEENITTQKTILNMCVNDIYDATIILSKAINADNKILWCGNGGSAADAQHMAAELMGGLTTHDRPPIASIALTTDTSFITAWSNDTDYNAIFSRQIEGIGKDGDILIAISTSGNSINIINAIKAAKVKKMKVIILTGETGGKMHGHGDVQISIPSNNTQRIQEGHLLVEHILCEFVEMGIIQNNKQ